MSEATTMKQDTDTGEVAVKRFNFWTNAEGGCVDEDTNGKFVLYSSYEASRAGTHKTALQAKESIDEMKASLAAVLAQKEALEKELGKGHVSTQFWRDDAFRSAAEIVDRYAKHFPEVTGAAEDIRALISRPEAPHEAK